MKNLLNIALLLSLWLAASAGAEDYPFLAARVKTLVSFKDGTVFVLKQGSVKVGAGGKVVTEAIADAAFGSVGVTSLTEGVKVRSLTASAPPAAAGQALTFADSRSKVHGRPVSVLRHGATTAIEGELLGLRPPSAIAQAIGMPAVTQPEDLVLAIKQSSGLLALLPMAEVEECRFLDGKQTERDPERTGQHLTIALEGATEGQEVSLAYYYLWTGIRWTPSYILERRKDGSVRAELRGEIQNDLVDLEGTRVFLAVGIPSFAFLKTPSPLAVQKSLQQVTAALQAHLPAAGNLANNAQFAQLVSNVQMPATLGRLEGAEPTPQGRGLLAVTGQASVSSTDAGSVHLYEVENIDLAKGERTIVGLSNMDLGCRDLVAWDIPDAQIGTAVHTVEPADRRACPPVHYWLLRTGDAPLTTGPALVMQGETALSQDTVYYTPRQGEGRFRAGIAVGMTTDATETVLSRTPGSKEVNDRQTNHGSTAVWLKKEIRWTDERRELRVRIRNGLPFATDLQVTRQLRGRPERHPQVTFRTLGGMTDTVDEINRLEWDISLKPGQEREVRIEYVARIFEGN